jgi:hypothetical protein
MSHSSRWSAANPLGALGAGLVGTVWAMRRSLAHP